MCHWKVSWVCRSNFLIEYVRVVHHQSVFNVTIGLSRHTAATLYDRVRITHHFLRWHIWKATYIAQIYRTTIGCCCSAHVLYIDLHKDSRQYLLCVLPEAVEWYVCNGTTDVPVVIYISEQLLMAAQMACLLAQTSECSVHEETVPFKTMCGLIQDFCAWALWCNTGIILKTQGWSTHAMSTDMCRSISFSFAVPWTGQEHHGMASL